MSISRIIGIANLPACLNRRPQFCRGEKSWSRDCVVPTEQWLASRWRTRRSPVHRRRRSAARSLGRDDNWSEPWRPASPLLRPTAGCARRRDFQEMASSATRSQNTVRSRRWVSCWWRKEHGATSTDGTSAGDGETLPRRCRVTPMYSSPRPVPTATPCEGTTTDCRCRRRWSHSRRDGAAPADDGLRPGSLRGCWRGSCHRGPGRRGLGGSRGDGAASGDGVCDREDGHRGRRPANSREDRAPSTIHTSSLAATASEPRPGWDQRLSDRAQINPTDTTQATYRRNT